MTTDRRPSESPSEQDYYDLGAACTCGPGIWGNCHECGRDLIVHHACPGGCDDVTCEDIYVCGACLGAAPCPMHNGPYPSEKT